MYHYLPNFIKVDKSKTFNYMALEPSVHLGLPNDASPHYPVTPSSDTHNMQAVDATV